MISKSTLITFFVLLFATASFGQGFVVSFNSLTEPLTTACGSGTPLPDGTPILIFTDPGFDGPTDDDYQPIVGTATGNVNYNSFNINGVGIQAGAGLFANSTAWVSQGAVPEPPYFYLLVCAGDIQYYTSTVFVGSGFQEFNFPDEIEGNSWTCLTETCDICLPPAQPTNLDASDNLCNGINLTWNHDGVDICGFDIMRDDELVATIEAGVSPFSYLDAGAPNGVHSYRIKAIRCCPDETQVFSGLSGSTNGTRLPGPPVPTLQFVSTDLCDVVDVRVLIATVQGLNELRIYRVGEPPVLVGTITDMTAGVPRTIVDNDPPVGPVSYYAVGYSTTCGEGTPSITLPGLANFAPACVSVVTSVSTDLCDRITITWTYTCADADSFRIRRNTTVIATVSADNPFTYNDTGTVPGVVTGYAVIPANACGDGTASTPMVGHRADSPGPVAGASAVGSCDCIEIRWNDFPVGQEIIDYGVYRNNELIFAVAPGVQEYLDCDPALVPGVQYSYSLTATNECGEGDHSTAVTGSLLPPNAGGATLALVSEGPPNWDYSMTWVSGCVARLMIRDLCPGTTGAFTGTGWTVTNYADSIVWITDSPLGEGTITGFRLTNTSNCAGTGRWTAGGGGGSIEGPLPVGRIREIPKEYALSIYPNPFNPATTLEFALPKAGLVQVNVYDIIGRLVNEVVSGEFEAGFHKVNFDASSLPSGLYFARINSRDFVMTKKLMLVK